MLSKRELLEEIEYCEAHLSDYKDCQRLAALYTIYDHKYKKRSSSGEPISEVIVQTDGNSEFLSAIKGKNASDMWDLINDLMQVLEEDNPRLYEHVMSRI